MNVYSTVITFQQCYRDDIKTFVFLSRCEVNESLENYFIIQAREKLRKLTPYYDDYQLDQVIKTPHIL